MKRIKLLESKNNYIGSKFFINMDRSGSVRDAFGLLSKVRVIEKNRFV